MLNFSEKLEEAQGYRQQGEEAFQGSVPDAQHRLRRQREDKTYAPHRLQESACSQC